LNSVSEFITGLPTHSDGGARLVTVAGVSSRRLSSSLSDCNTLLRACRQLHSRRLGDDIMPPSDRIIH